LTKATWEGAVNKMIVTAAFDRLKTIGEAAPIKEAGFQLRQPMQQ